MLMNWPEGNMNTALIFRIAFWVLFGSVMVMRGYFASRVRKAGQRLMPNQQAVEREGRGAFALRVGLFFILMAWLVLYAIYPTWVDRLSVNLPNWLRWTGFVIGVAGLALWAWAQASLDTLWSAQLQLRPEHHLVKTGPYAKVRHPIYTAMLFIATAFALVSAHWVFILFSAVAILAFLARVPREEQMMIEQFREGYQNYMRDTGRFFPKWEGR